MRLLITGGTTFVSKYAASYFVEQGHDVYVLNRNSKRQVDGVTLIEADRHKLGDKIRNIRFDAILDITAYDAADIEDLFNALGSFGQYVMVSSSAVYPEYAKQPFAEDGETAENKFWGKYGTDKIGAEKKLTELCREAYILRPPYLYGPMNNVYREAFVFDCAKNDRKFYLPGDGEMRLQFLHVRDLCKIMERIINTLPDDHVINVGNKDAVTVKEWVTLCYKCLGKEPVFVNVDKDVEQRKYFSFYDYEYFLDVKKQQSFYPDMISLEDGLRESARWYLENEEDVRKKPLMKFIDEELA